MKRSSTVLAALLALLLVATNDAARHRKYRQTCKLSAAVELRTSTFVHNHNHFQTKTLTQTTMTPLTSKSQCSHPRRRFATDVTSPSNAVPVLLTTLFIQQSDGHVLVDHFHLLLMILEVVLPSIQFNFRMLVHTSVCRTTMETRLKQELR